MRALGAASLIRGPSGRGGHLHARAYHLPFWPLRGQIETSAAVELLRGMQRLAFRGDVLENPRMAALYPAGPRSVPENLTEPTGKYRNRAWLATGGLIAFTLLYLALSGWFAWTAWRLFNAALAGQFETRWGWLWAVGAAFLAVFMIKALFFVQHRHAIDAVELKRDEQPSSSTSSIVWPMTPARRARTASSSPARVNAAVFYDLSLLNLIVPVEKEPRDRPGARQRLTLGELKAVLAHEFGHFAQRSMAVGAGLRRAADRGQIIARRDMLDRFLAAIALRRAVAGSAGAVLIFWSIRSLTDTVFRVVLLAQRALSREMEFQADLVAVSLTGSDALIHALHKISFAEYAWDNAMGFAATRRKRGDA